MQFTWEGEIKLYLPSLGSSKGKLQVFIILINKSKCLIGFKVNCTTNYLTVMLCFAFIGINRWFPPPVGVWPIGCWEEDPHYVHSEGALRARCGTIENRTSNLHSKLYLYMSSKLIVDYLTTNWKQNSIFVQIWTLISTALCELFHKSRSSRIYSWSFLQLT